MKTMMTLTMTLALAVPMFAAKTYNSSHSNTANVAAKDSKSGNQTPSKSIHHDASNDNASNDNASKSNTGN